MMTRWSPLNLVVTLLFSAALLGVETNVVAMEEREEPKTERRTEVRDDDRLEINAVIDRWRKRRERLKSCYIEFEVRDSWGKERASMRYVAPNRVRVDRKDCSWIATEDRIWHADLSTETWTLLWREPSFDFAAIRNSDIFTVDPFLLTIHYVFDRVEHGEGTVTCHLKPIVESWPFYDSVSITLDPRKPIPTRITTTNKGLFSFSPPSTVEYEVIGFRPNVEINPNDFEPFVPEGWRVKSIRTGAGRSGEH